MLFLHFCKPLFTDSAKPPFYIPCKNLIFTDPEKLFFTYRAKTSFLHTLQKLLFTWPATPIFMLLQTPFYLFCNTFFLHILRKPPFMFLTTDAAEIYLSCKYERHSHFAQYVILRMWPKLSAVHQNPIWADLRAIQTTYR